MTEHVPINVPEAIQGHKAESDRLGRLVEFLSRFAPAIGETKQSGHAVECPDVTSSRDRAIVAAFAAVERLADASFPFPPKGGAA